MSGNFYAGFQAYGSDTNIVTRRFVTLHSPDYKDASASEKTSSFRQGCRNPEPWMVTFQGACARLSTLYQVMHSHPCDWILASMPV